MTDNDESDEAVQPYTIRGTKGDSRAKQKKVMNPALQARIEDNLKRRERERREAREKRS